MTTQKPDVIAASSFREAQFEPRQSTSRFIADALRAAIVEGSLLPGEPLRQDAIARQFSVSAIPVREAFRQLDSEGWRDLRDPRVAGKPRDRHRDRASHARDARHVPRAARSRGERTRSRALRRA
jgi:DNA-binding GntR family transcriptional regulator